MYNKAVLMNLALQALLLTKQITDPASDQSNEAKVLNQIYDVAFRTALIDLDLDSTCSQNALELVEENPNNQWLYSYKYPQNCLYLRRLIDPQDYSSQTMDDKFTRVLLQVFIKDGKKVIFTNLVSALAQWIPHDFPLQTLSPSAGMAIAQRLAWMACPLIVGKGANRLRQEIEKNYVIYKVEAQALDSRESFNFQSDEVLSEFVKTRLS